MQALEAQEEDKPKDPHQEDADEEEPHHNFPHNDDHDDPSTPPANTTNNTNTNDTDQQNTNNTNSTNTQENPQTQQDQPNPQNNQDQEMNPQQLHTIGRLMEVGYTRAEAIEAIRASLTAEEGVAVETPTINEEDKPCHKEELRHQEEELRAKIREQFRRARNVDARFNPFMPHIPLLFM